MFVTLTLLNVTSKALNKFQSLFAKGNILKLEYVPFGVYPNGVGGQSPHHRSQLADKQILIR